MEADSRTTAHWCAFGGIQSGFLGLKYFVDYQKIQKKNPPKKTTNTQSFALLNGRYAEPVERFDKTISQI
jgi:hypothetical protein